MACGVANMLFITISSIVLQIWSDHCGESEGPVQAASVEPPAQLLQGAEGSGRRPVKQPEREPHAVQQATEAGQRHQPGELNVCSGHSGFLTL